MNFVSAIFGAIANVFGYLRDRTNLNNTPEMKKADCAKKDCKLEDKKLKEIKNADLKAIRKRLSR
jgi:hypothetical protein